MEGAVVMTGSCDDTFSLQLLPFLGDPFDSGTDPAVGCGVVWSGTGDRLHLKLSGLGLVLPPCPWKPGSASLSMAWLRPSCEPGCLEGMLRFCFPVFFPLLEVNFHSGYKLGRKGSTCNFLSASFCFCI